MPVQKGKRRKRPRHRERGESDEVEDVAHGSSPVSPKRESGLFRRRRWEPSFRINLVVGSSLLVLGILFAVTPQKGFGTGAHAIILLGYFALAALYLSKAYRQYRAKHPDPE